MLRRIVAVSLSIGLSSIVIVAGCSSGGSSDGPAAQEGGTGGEGGPGPEKDGSAPDSAPPNCTPPVVSGATVLGNDGLGAVDAVAVDGTDVYLLTAEIGAGVKYGVYKVAKAGGARTLAADATVARANARLFVDAAKIYWSDSDGLHAAPKAGGGAQVLATSAKEPTGVVFDGTAFFWPELGPGGATKMLSVPVAGGTPTTVQTISDSNELIALDATYVYYAHGLNLQRFPRGGGADTTIYTVTTAGELVRDVAVDGTSAYLLGDTDIRKMPAAGGALTAVTTASKPAGPRLEGANIFWTERKAGTTGIVRNEQVIKLAPLAGGAAKTLVEDEWPITAYATDAEYVYWASQRSSVCPSVVRRLKY